MTVGAGVSHVPRRIDGPLDDLSDAVEDLDELGLDGGTAEVIVDCVLIEVEQQTASAVHRFAMGR